MKMKKIEIALLLGTILTAFICIDMACFASVCEEIKTDLVRMHVIANSDSKYDQEIKLKVKDAVIVHISKLTFGFDSKEEAMQLIAENLPQIEAIAKNVLLENGCNYTVRCSLEKRYFDTRYYEDFTTPAGIYETLSISIGEANGENWWCVAFPAICIPAAKKDSELQEVLTAEEIDIISNENYKMKFFIVELFEKFFSSKN